MTRGASASLGPALRSLRPQSTPRHFLHENRETSEAPATVYRGRSAGKGDRRTARMHVSEESDSGVVPMKHSNKDRRSSAESAEGRPLVKENTHPSHTCPTQCGKRVSQGWMGVRRAAYRFAAMYPRQEPYALMSARTDLCRGYQATGIPTATPSTVPSMEGNGNRRNRVRLESTVSNAPDSSMDSPSAKAERTSLPMLLGAKSSERICTTLGF